MTNEQLKKRCPIICKSIDLYPARKYAILAQAEFFKTHTFIFDVLDNREAQILRLRYGIGFEKGYTLNEIAQMLNISHERVQQIEARAYEILRQPRCMMWLRDYTDETFDKALLNTLDIDYNSLIKRDIVRFLHQNDLKLLEEISIKEMGIKYRKTPKSTMALITKLEQAGFKTGADLLEYMSLRDNLLDVGISYLEYSSIIFALAELIEKGKLRIVSKHNQHSYNLLISKKSQHMQSVTLQQSNGFEYQKRKQEQELFKDVVYADNIDMVSIDPNRLNIEKLGFSLRVYNRLKQHNVNTVQDIIDFYNNNKEDFQVMRRLGSVGEKEIIEKLTKLGISLVNTAPSQEVFMYRARKHPEKVLIESLHFSKRVYKFLISQGIETVKDLMDKQLDITNVKNLGVRSQLELIYKMHELGIDFSINIVDNKLEA